MALMTCPECTTQMSDTAHACPRCGWARASLAANEAQAAEAAARQATAEEGRKLVNKSTLLALVAVALMFSGCGLARVTKSGLPAMGGLIVGFIVLIIAAIIGQIGRGKQGRII